MAKRAYDPVISALPLIGPLLTAISALARWLMLAAPGVVIGLPLVEFYRQSPNVRIGCAEAAVMVPALARSAAE
jgi:hypothetical protein